MTLWEEQERREFLKRQALEILQQEADQPHLSITLQFSHGGCLRAVFFNADTDIGQEVLEKAFFRLTKREHSGWLTRLLMRK